MLMMPYFENNDATANMSVVLTDLHPQTDIWSVIASQYPKLTFVSEPYDAQFAEVQYGDIVYLRAVLHHLREDTVRRIFANALAHGATVVVSDLLPTGFPLELAFRIIAFPVSGLHILNHHLRRYFINNFNMNMLGTAIVSLPFLLTFVIWDHIGPTLSAYSLVDLRRILSDLSRETGLWGVVSAWDSALHMFVTFVITRGASDVCPPGIADGSCEIEH